VPRLFIRCRVDSVLKLAQRPSASWQIHRIGGVGSGKNPGLAASFGRPAGKATQHKAPFTELAKRYGRRFVLSITSDVPQKAWSAELLAQGR